MNTLWNNHVNSLRPLPVEPQSGGRCVYASSRVSGQEGPSRRHNPHPFSLLTSVMWDCFKMVQYCEYRRSESAQKISLGFHERRSDSGALTSSGQEFRPLFVASRSDRGLNFYTTLVLFSINKGPWDSNGFFFSLDLNVQS